MLLAEGGLATGRPFRTQGSGPRTELTLRPPRQQVSAGLHLPYRLPSSLLSLEVWASSLTLRLHTVLAPSDLAWSSSFCAFDPTLFDPNPNRQPGWVPIGLVNADWFGRTTLSCAGWSFCPRLYHWLAYLLAAFGSGDFSCSNRLLGHLRKWIQTLRATVAMAIVITAA